MKARILNVVFAATVVLMPLHAVAGPHATKDLRNSTDADGGDREISICARPSPDTAKNLPGHVFVAYSLRQKSGARLYLAVGHTTFAPPARTLITYFGAAPVSGHLQEELYTSSKEECLVLKVNEADFNRAYQLSRPFLPPGNFTPDPRNWSPVLLAYTLGENDCMGFATGVARSFESRGLTVPQRGSTELPLQYVRRMIQAN